MTASPDARPRTTILMPLYEDWASCKELLTRIDEALTASSRRARVLVVDDASPTVDPQFASGMRFQAIDNVDVLSLRRNLGHQRAIGVGLAYLETDAAADTILIMDSDGEDSPSDIPALLDAFEQAGETKVIFAERTRRSEGVVFAFFYAFFRLAHRILTGHRVRVGNFSVLSSRAARSLVVVPELWNHYAAAVFTSGLRYASIPTARGHRIAGQSKMSFVRLVMHGLSAISVFSDVVSVRVLLATGLFLTMAIIATIAAVAGRGIGMLVLPEWAVSLSAVLFLAILQGIAFVLLFTFTVLSNRKAATVLLARDYVYFIDEVKPVYK